MRLSIRRLVHLVALVVLVQMVIYLWSIKRPHKVVLPVVLLEKQVQPEKKGEGTCNYELCPKVKEGVLNVHMIAHSHIDVGWTHTVDEFYTGAAVDPDGWEAMAQDRPTWRANITEDSRLAEEDRNRKTSKEGSSIPSTVFTCTKCDRACASRIGLISHMKACKGKVSSSET